MVSMEINDNLLNVARLHEETIFYIILLIDRLKQKGKIWLCTKKWKKNRKFLIELRQQIRFLHSPKTYP